MATVRSKVFTFNDRLSEEAHKSVQKLYSDFLNSKDILVVGTPKRVIKDELTTCYYVHYVLKDDLEGDIL